MNGFRLTAIYPELREDGRSFRSNVNRAQKFDIAPTSGSDSENWFSVITGPNGLGKSRALAAAASLLIGAQYINGRSREHRGEGWRISYSYDGHDCELWAGGGKKLQALMDGDAFPPDSLPLPRRVIALATTATDKFPLAGTPRDSEATGREDFYNYLGLRDRIGRASATVGVQRALEELMEATQATMLRRARIAEVFELLRYTPRVVHTYRWRYSALRDGPGGIGDVLTRPTRFRQLADKDPDLIVRAQDAIRSLWNGHDTLIQITADFREPYVEDLVRFESVQLLRRAGLLESATTELERADTGAVIDLREASSGELSMATAFLGLAATIENDSVILIDEPEVSLHPAWQSRYLPLMNDIFSAYHGCHFVVATHSPLIVSGIPSRNATVHSVDPDITSTGDGADYSGDSVDELLIREFGVASASNLFLKQSLVLALRLAADGAVDSAQFQATLRPLIGIAGKLDSEAATRKLIEQLVRASGEMTR